jgi:hypothetical protein
MRPILIAMGILVSLVRPVLADDQLGAAEIRKVVPGNWSGTYKNTSLVVAVSADGAVKGRYGGIAASGSWSVKVKPAGARLCLTFQSVISETKCGELYRKGNNVLYGFTKPDGTHYLWLKRS